MHSNNRLQFPVTFDEYVDSDWYLLHEKNVSSLVLNIRYVLNETHTDVRMYTLMIYFIH